MKSRDADLCPLIADVQAGLGLQLSSARLELGQAQAILADAIGKLVESFNTLQRRVGAPMLGDEDSGPMTAQAVTALQFQDMVSQSLHHVSYRIDLLEAGIASLAEVASVSSRDAPSDEFRAVMQRAHEIFQRLSHNPVSQQSAVSGEIELF